ncbi:MAG: glycosyltransferase family 39 protein [Oscillospiraceae bacterium]|jgi:4-amino-4-deoxy-L-arabinose transferase-like glycosyltransferase|nr:glycosyltransferase family 39 protein [Oscillospiraceae bacterium]
MREKLPGKEKLVKPKLPFWILIGILALSFFLNFWNIGQNGTGNAYYAACVKSMTQSWHNFFFASFDPAGMVSVDKPPLGLWMQALSCKVFGYSGWAMLLPQALAGTLSCLLIYLLTSRYFKKPAGLTAAFLFAVTPSVVLVSRNSTMDMQLIFWLLLSVWFLMKSIDTGKWRWLLVCGVLVGVGFNVKMLQAYLIVPAIIVTYLIFAKEKFWKRFAAGVVAAVVMLGVSFAWVAAVDLTPASERPYVDSTTNNSALELVFGHNGVERLTGQDSMNDGKKGSAHGNFSFNRFDGSGSRNSAKSGTNFRIPGNSTVGPAGRTDDGKGQMMGRQQGGGGNDIGTASIFRLWNDSLYGQGSWLLVFAIVSLAVCLSWKKLKQKDAAQRSLVFWGMWLLTAGVLFSFAGFFHAYYLCMIAPPVAVIAGVGLTELFRFFHWRWVAPKTAEPQAEQFPEATGQTTELMQAVPASKRFRLQEVRPWILLAGLLAGIIFSIIYVYQYASVSGWLVPLILVPCIAGIALLYIYLKSAQQEFLRVAVVLLVISMLAGSAYWAWTPVQTVPNATMPTAGPSRISEKGGMGVSGGQQGGEIDSGLEAYLKKNYQEGSFLLTTCRSSTVAQLIIGTGLPCYAYGGFLGSDNSLTVERLKALVAEGKVTYFLLSEQNGGPNGGSSSSLTSYVEQNAKKIDPSKYSSSSTNGHSAGTLYQFTKS